MADFMSSYKHLEKLCGDILQDDRRISAYIDEMTKIASGSSAVHGWNEDLKKLKHYRWVRNQIVHDPDYEEEDLCGPNDVLWLENFYSRIRNPDRPLALYYHLTKKGGEDNRKKQESVRTNTYDTYNRQPMPRREPEHSSGGMILVVCVIIIVACVLFLGK